MVDESIANIHNYSALELLLESSAIQPCNAGSELCPY